MSSVVTTQNHMTTEDAEDTEGTVTAKKGTAEAVPSLLHFQPCTSGTLAPTLTYEPFTTSRLFCTLKTPKTWLARMPAICLSIAVATVP